MIVVKFLVGLAICAPIFAAALALMAHLDKDDKQWPTGF